MCTIDDQPDSIFTRCVAAVSNILCFVRLCLLGGRGPSHNSCDHPRKRGVGVGGGGGRGEVGGRGAQIITAVITRGKEGWNQNTVGTVWKASLGDSRETRPSVHRSFNRYNAILSKTKRNPD